MINIILHILTNFTNEIFVALAGIVSSYIAWSLGGKQQASNTRIDSITSGTDQIIDSSKKIVNMLERMIEIEREHRINCELELKEIKERISVLESRASKIC